MHRIKSPDGCSTSNDQRLIHFRHKQNTHQRFTRRNVAGIDVVLHYFRLFVNWERRLRFVRRKNDRQPFADESECFINARHLSLTPDFSTGASS